MPQVKYRLKLTLPAELDYTDIIRHIAEYNVNAAQKMISRIDSMLALLRKNPRLGPGARDERLAAKGYRYLVIGCYLAFYLIEGNTIWVQRILHGARDYALSQKDVYADRDRHVFG